MQNVEVRRMAEKVVCTEFMGGGNEWSQSILLASDQHFDSADCDRDLLKKHLEEARATNALVFFLGYWFDAMQGRSDKRGNKSGIRQEYKRSDYLNALISGDPSLREITGALKGISFALDGPPETDENGN